MQDTTGSRELQNEERGAAVNATPGAESGKDSATFKVQGTHEIVAGISMSPIKPVHGHVKAAKMNSFC